MTNKSATKALTLFGILANIIIAVITIIAAYGGTVNPNKTTIPAIISMTFPVLVCLTIVSLIICLFVNRKIAIIPGITLLLSFSSILNICPLNLPHKALTPDEEQRSFSVLSYNVYSFTNYFQSPINPRDTLTQKDEARLGLSNPTLSYILSCDADLVSLQECYISLLSNNHGYISTALYDSICSKYPYRICELTNAILSKHPLKQIKIQQPLQRSGYIIGAETEIDGRQLLFISVHLKSLGLDQDDKAIYREITKGEGGRQAISDAKSRLLTKLSNAFRSRADQAELLRHQIDSIGIEDVIIAGDFNDIEGCYAQRIIQKDNFKSVYREAGFGPVITYNANRFYFNIDHILYRGSMEAVDYSRKKFKRSDHYPIQAQFIWSDNNTN